MLERYARGVESGLLTVPMAASAVLDELADAPDSVALWAGAPSALRESVLGFIAGVGLDGLPPVFVFGISDPSWRAAQAARRRAVAAELLAANAEPGAASS